MAEEAAAAPPVPELKEESKTASFGGWVKMFSHESEVLKCSMKLAVYLPPQAEDGDVPVVYWLSGLTCTEQNFITKAGAQRAAAKHGFCLVCPDTSPRGVPVEGDEDGWDFGTGAGFYVDATVDKWATNYNMYSYVTQELPAIVTARLPVTAAASIMGHSMGGHGALVCALRNPGMYRSVSAFAPICHPSECPWGKKAFSGYLGDDKAAWAEYDATELVAKYKGLRLSILIDQGKSDNFYTQKQLLPEDFIKASATNEVVTTALRMQDGYDHSYYFIASFIDDHLDHHAEHLKEAGAE